ncbi:hypothetical protein G7046_g1630 [Stylonectria norvegica]|nr:hypothetical protein G7046_g1630 [Stylonectria norvegica]
MSSLRGLYGKESDESAENNFGVEFVVRYKVPANERAGAEAGFVQLIEALTSVGLSTEVRHGDKDSLLVFVKVAHPDLLAQQVYRARLQDWLHGVRTSAPDDDASQALESEPVTEAERLRLIYLIITKPQSEGGAGITPSTPKWKHVESIFPLHNHAFNKAWIQKWSTKYVVTQDDIDEIRSKFGENVAFYFAFLRAYFRFLIIPSALGFGSWLLLGQFSWVYALLNGLWSVVFFEFWKKEETDLAVQWGVRGVSNIQQSRPEFEWEHEAEDPITGEAVKVYPPLKRVQTQLLQIPFGVVCIVVLGSLVVTCNSLEVFINEVYNGPGKSWLTFLPTILLVIGTPTFSSILMSAAEKLNTMENYATVDAYDAALIQKQFILNFMTSYMALLFTAFVYVPFGHILIPFLDFWRKTAQAITFSEKPLATQEFHSNPDRISKQMFYFTVTAQIVNFLTEVVVPYVKREVFQKAKEFRTKDADKTLDHEEEAEFLERVRKECELEAYDVSGDYREMVMQFGYLSLFSVAWPLAACCFLINNWVELRSDALKIAISCRRPIPWRSDSIGPWLTALGFLSWLGSITSAAIVFLCSGTHKDGLGTASQVTAWGLLLSILLAEHFYLLVQMAVRFVMTKLDSPGLQKERKERFQMKKKLLGDNLGQGVSARSAAPGIENTEKITRASLEEEARNESLHGHGTPEDRFWKRQRGMQDTIQIGRKLIEQQPLKRKSFEEALSMSKRVNLQRRRDRWPVASHAPTPRREARSGPAPGRRCPEARETRRLQGEMKGPMARPNPRVQRAERGRREVERGLAIGGVLCLWERAYVEPRWTKTFALRGSNRSSWNRSSGSVRGASLRWAKLLLVFVESVPRQSRGVAWSRLVLGRASTLCILAGAIGQSRPSPEHTLPQPLCVEIPLHTPAAVGARTPSRCRVVMDDIADLVLTPFREIVEKGRTAVENAGDTQPMLKTSQNLFKEGTRALKRIEPLCKKHLDEYGSNFLDALKENDEIADFRSELTDLLWEFDDYIEVDDFEADKFAELQAVSRKAAPKIYDILMRMKLEVPDDNDARSVVMMRMSAPSSPPPMPPPPVPFPMARSQSQLSDSRSSRSETPSAREPPNVHEATAQLRMMMQSQSGPEEGLGDITRNIARSTKPAPPPVAQPPRPPSTDPWDVTAPPIPPREGRMREDFAFQRRPPVAAPESPVSPATSSASLHRDGSHGRDVRDGRDSRDARDRKHPANGPRPLNIPMDRSSHQSDERSYSPSGLETASYERPHRVFSGQPPRPRTSATNSFLSSSIPEDGVSNRESGSSKFSPPAYRYPQSPGYRMNTFSRPESLESNATSVFDNARMVNRASTAASTNAPSEHQSPDVSDAQSSPTLGMSQLTEISPTKSLPRVSSLGARGSEQSPVLDIDFGPIPVEMENLSAPNPNLQLSTPDCEIDATSSFHLHKGFCEGAQDVVRGGIGVRKTKKPGYATTSTVARCLHCFFELDFNEIELDVNKSDRGNFTKAGISFRLRFLQKSHISTRRVDDILYACLFCVRNGRTLNPSDATVFVSQKALFQHLALHPRPLPEIHGVTVVDQAEVPEQWRNNYDIHFKNPPEPHPVLEKSEEIANLPTATSKDSARRMYGQRLLFDRTPALEMVQGAKITGLTWPEKYNGEWCFGWHDGVNASAPMEIVRLDQPPSRHIKLGVSSPVRATTRWKFDQKEKDKFKGDWLKFGKGETITDITWPYPEYWCWSGTNSKGKYGIFPRDFIDMETVEDLSTGIDSDRVSALSSEKNRSMSILSRFGTRKSGRTRPPSIAGSTSSHETTPALPPAYMYSRG